MRHPLEQYERDRTALKHFLIGRRYTEALSALGIAERWHVGVRKDKVTPELHHQVWVVFNFLNTPIDGLTDDDEQSAIAALLDHDVVEDYPVTYEYLAQHGLRPRTISLVKGLTKVDGETQDEMLERLLGDWLLPILKGCDRDNNVMTMQGAFKLEKMKSYCKETREVILVLLKRAGRLYPEHNRSYVALAAGIKKQLRIYEGFIAALEEKEAEIAALKQQAEAMQLQLSAKGRLAAK